MRLPVALLASFSLLGGEAAAVTKEEIRVPMRDGVELAMDLYKPDGAAGPLPVIVTLTPYHALYKGLGDGAQLVQWRFTNQGYAVAMVDVRGTYESGGCWDYGGLRERQDGYDLVEWIARQPWSNGRVAMIGASYDGTTANAAAVENPPHLATIVPISAISRWYGYAYSQGVRHSYSGETDDADPPSDTPADFQFGYGFLPPPEPGAATSAQQIAMRWNLCDRAEQFQHGYDPEPDFDEFWVERDYLRLAGRVTAPVLLAHGFEDYNVKTWEGTQFYDALPGEKAMVVGQWPHALPEWPDWNLFLDRWFARWLKGERNGVEHEAPVVSQGADGEYRLRRRWTGTGLLTVPLGTADASFFDDGALTESEMLRDACGPRCLRLELPALAGQRLVGRPRVRLKVTSDRTSTHLVATLVDKAPDGSRRVISRGFMNARYRQGLEQGKDLEPGKPFDATVELIDHDHPVGPDHTVELFLASSSTTWVVSDENRATNVVHLGQSFLDFPVDGPEPPDVGPVTPPPAAKPGPGPIVRPLPKACRTRLTVRLPRGARGSVRATVDGRRARARKRKGRVVVTLPRTRRGRAVVRVVVRVKGRRVTLTRRTSTCRR